MQSHYWRQAMLPYFFGHTRQRRSGFGLLAVGVGLAALPFAEKFILSVVESIGKELFMPSWSELLEVALKEESKLLMLKDNSCMVSIERVENK